MNKNAALLQNTALTLNKDCHCWPVERGAIIAQILKTHAAPDMDAMLSVRPHYFAATSVFLSWPILEKITDQIKAIEAAIKLPGYIDTVAKRSLVSRSPARRALTKGVFMGYDFHISEAGPRLIEINSNAGGAFIVDQIETALNTSDGQFADKIAAMFKEEWAAAGREATLKTIAIVDENPKAQFHYPDMCLAKSLLQNQGFAVIIADPSECLIKNGKLYHGSAPIDLVYNRLTDFALSEPQNTVIQRAYFEDAAVITPAPHTHALFADKRNLINLSNPKFLSHIGAAPQQIRHLSSIPKTALVTAETADQMWTDRKKLFFKPEAGFGSRGAFRGAKLTKKVWQDILKGGYIAQERVSPPLRAVTVNDKKTALKFDLRVYTYDGEPLLFAARVYQGQTTNLRTDGGGLAAVVQVTDGQNCVQI